MDERGRSAHERARLQHELNTALAVLQGRLQLGQRRASRIGTEVTLMAGDVAALAEAIARLRAAVEDVDRELDRR